MSQDPRTWRTPLAGGHLSRRGFPRPFPSVLAVLACAFGAGCARAPADGVLVERTDSAGVEIVRNVSQDLPLRLASNAVRALGGKDTPEESFYQVGSWNVAADERGNLYVLDRSAHRVHSFDSTGRHRRTVGGQGGGPGELQFPIVLTVSPEGSVAVVDIARRAIVRWGPDGEVLAPEALPEGFTGGAIAWTRGGWVVHVRGGQGSRVVVASGAGEPSVLAALPPNPTKVLDLKTCGIGFSGMPPIFSPDLVWTVRGSRVVVASTAEYALDVYEGGSLVRSLRRDVPRRPATMELAKASLGDGMRVRTPQGERICDPGEVAEQRGVAPFVPVIGALAMAPDGTLWVQRHALRDTDRSVDLFDPVGRYMGSLPEGSPFPIGFLPDGRLLMSEKNDEDLEQVVIRTAELTRSRE